MAAALEYADKYYLNLQATLDDGSPVTVKIDRYLNNALKDDTRDHHNRRNLAANDAKDALLGDVVNELNNIAQKEKRPKLPGILPPPTFEIASATGEVMNYNLLDLVYVSLGKGSPDAIRKFIRLASRYGHTTRETVGDYCTKNIGLDCNGFACNFWGIAADTSIGGYDVNRRQAVGDVTTGDAMIFYHTDGSAPNPYHIAVVDEVNVNADQFRVIVAQSAGLEQGLEHYTYTPDGLTSQNARAPKPREPRNPPVGYQTAGDLFVRKAVYGIDSTIFFAAGPAKGKSRV
jgi:hypothetical protein